MEIIYGSHPTNYKKCTLKFLPSEQELDNFDRLVARYADFLDAMRGDARAEKYDNLHELFKDMIARCTDMPAEDVKELAPESCQDIYNQILRLDEKRKKGEI